MKSNKQVKLEQRKAEANRKKQRKHALWIFSALAILAAIIFLIVANQKQLPGKSVKVMANQPHLKSVDSSHVAYNSDPPTSGPHPENLANWGFYKESIPKELLVHNLEDGGVVIYYNSTVNPMAIDKLSKLVGSYSEQVVANSYPKMKNQITLTAWGRIDRLDSYNEKRIKKFINAFKGIDHH